jgi:hypothetical protein
MRASATWMLASAVRARAASSSAFCAEVARSFSSACERAAVRRATSYSARPCTSTASAMVTSAWRWATWARAVSRALWGVGDFGTRLRELGLQGLDVHARDHVVARDEVAFVNQDRVHPPGRLGGDIDLGGLDAAVAAHEAAVVRSGAQELPGAGRGQDEDTGAQPGQPAGSFHAHEILLGGSSAMCS